MRGMTFTTAAAVALAAVVLASCGTEATGPGGAVAAIRITPATDTLGTLGGTRQLSAAAVDANGAPVAGATITWRSSAPGVISVDTVTGLVTALANGTATITASAGGKSAAALLTVAQVIATITVTPATAALSALGAAQTFSAVAKDSGGSVVAGTRFLWISSDPTVAVVDTNGLATAKGPGTATITAAGRGIPGSARLSVTQTARRLAFTVEPSGAVAGAALSPAVQVTVEDSTGTRVRDATEAVTLALGTNPGGATLSGTVTVNAVDGVATFSGLSLDKADSGYTLAATAGGLTGAASASFAVTPAAPAALAVVTDPPASVTAGTAFGAVVAIEDAFGNVVPAAADTVRLTLAANPEAATLGGTTAAAAVNGLASFASLKLTRADSGYALLASAGGLTPAESRAFAVTAAAPVGLGFVQQPAVAHGEQAMSPAVEVAVLDSFGNVVPAAADTVHLALLGAAGATLSGDTVEVAASGVARYTSLAVDNPGTYRLNASARGYSAVFSDTFDVHLFFGYVGLGLMSAGVYGSGNACSIVTGLVLYCWGQNADGQLGIGTTSSTTSPVAVKGGIQYVSDVSVGGGHTCAVTTAAALYCWGYNADGQLGDGSTTDTTLPERIGGFFSWMNVSAATSHTCAVTTGYAAYCWGYNGTGALGDSSRTSKLGPSPVHGGLQFWSVSTGSGVGIEFSCGVSLSNAAYCWGSNNFGQLGNGTTADTTLPVAVFGGYRFGVVSTGAYHACGVTIGTNAGLVYCWGYNGDGELGNGLTSNSPYPTEVAITGAGLTFQTVSAGFAHTCGITTTGAAYCWGQNDAGQLGNGTLASSTTPVAVAGGLTFGTIAAGPDYTCGVTTAGVAYCWGENTSGQLGDGTNVTSLVPVKVVQ